MAYPKLKTGYISNPNIGGIDFETYVDHNGISKVFAGGFRSNLDPKPITYYIDKSYDSSKVVTAKSTQN